MKRELLARPEPPSGPWLYTTETDELMVECGRCGNWWLANEHGRLEAELTCAECVADELAGAADRSIRRLERRLADDGAARLERVLGDDEIALRLSLVPLGAPAAARIVRKLTDAIGDDR